MVDRDADAGDWDFDPTEPREGTMIAMRYRLSSLIGRGSFGVVWRAKDTLTERAVAVKLVHPEPEMALSRAQLEVSALRRGLPGIVELLDDGLDDGRAFLVMELVEGTPFPGTPPPCSWEEIAPVVMSLLETLGWVHASFVIHRDLKPTNVLITPDQRVRLLDFGTAYRLAADAEDRSSGLEILGTPAYMAPEQIRNQELSERTDIYALGVMLYEALAGHLPHGGDTPGSFLRARLTRPSTPLLEVAPAVPPRVAGIIDQMLSTDPALRPASAFEIMAALRGEEALAHDLLWLGSRERSDQVSQAVRAEKSGPTVEIAPLSEIELRALFAGPDRLLHLREDGARLLYQRTGGLPARVVSEIDTWLRLGIARRSSNLLVVSRDALDDLAAGLPRFERGPVEAKSRDEELRRTFHATAAANLEPGTDRRLMHLVLASMGALEGRLAIAREACALATRLVDAGRVGAAIASLQTGIRAVRGMGAESVGERARLFALWLEAAFEQGTPGAFDRLLQALLREADWPEAAAIKKIACSLKVEDFTSTRALDLVMDVPPQSDARLERIRIYAWMNAVRLRRDDAQEERLLDELERSSGAVDPEIAARISHARGRLCHRQRRFAEAVEHHRLAAATGNCLHRITAKLAEAWALIDSYQMDLALPIAFEAEALAVEHRHAAHEAYAAWTLRYIAYRRGTAGAPDLELVAAASRAAGRQIQAAMLLTEAAVAFRAGLAEAQALASRSHELFSTINEQNGALLARCLGAALGSPIPAAEVRRLQESAMTSVVPGLGLQGIGLLASAGLLALDEIDEVQIASLGEQVPAEHWHTPIDILSIRESLSAIARARNMRAGGE